MRVCVWCSVRVFALLSGVFRIIYTQFRTLTIDAVRPPSPYGSGQFDNIRNAPLPDKYQHIVHPDSGGFGPSLLVPLLLPVSGRSAASRIWHNRCKQSQQARATVRLLRPCSPQSRGSAQPQSTPYMTPYKLVCALIHPIIIFCERESKARHRSRHDANTST